ncbi:MAG: MiaB/RimO family radical SAM methylthiotransferase [Candidatus Omnitrophota bacterium]
MSKKTFSVLSLGCFRNTYDSEVAARRLVDQGYAFKEDCSNCDTLVINTCGFISQAKEESLEVIQSAVDLKKKGKIRKLVVFGCLIQRYKEHLVKEFPEVDQWLGVEKFNSKNNRRLKITPSHIDFLKVCEGCIHNCSYCAIPLIKGPLKSRGIKDIINEVEYLDSTGIKELNLIGQDITSWGRDIGYKDGISVLLEKILKKVKKIQWIRLIYTHPRNVSDRLISIIASDRRVCKYIDLPIQHISDKILKLMKRRFSRKQTEALIEKIRKNIPGCVIRTSVITGFPAESEEEFKELYHFLKLTKFERLGAFTYSKEEETKAAKLIPQVHYKTKIRRYKKIMELQQDISREVNRRFLSKEIDVLVEEKSGGFYIGRTQYDAYEVDGVVFVGGENLRIGEIYPARIIDSHEYDLTAEVIK